MVRITRISGLWNVCQVKPSWICQSCARKRQCLSSSAPERPPLRHYSSTVPRLQYASPAMQHMRRAQNKRNQTTLYAWWWTRDYTIREGDLSSFRYYGLSIILATVALSYGSVPMYKMVWVFWTFKKLSLNSRLQICQQTGWGGQPVRSAAHGSLDGDPSTRLVPVRDATRLRITFAGSTSDILPWKFTPQQREVRVLPGETALAFYTATNTSEVDIIGVATYSVTPGQVAPYFSKIQCFCFEEQRLNAGETVDMPVFFYIDPDFLSDPNMKGIETITLNYTFFSEY